MRKFALTLFPAYTVAPEVAAGEGYDEKADLFSIGVLTFLLLTGEAPFGGDMGEGEDMAEVRDRIIACAVPYDMLDVSDLAVDFIKSLLVRDPSKRPTARQAQNHPWVRQRRIKQRSVLNGSIVNGLTSFKDLSATRKFLREVVTYTLDAGRNDIPFSLSELVAHFVSRLAYLPDQIEGLHDIEVSCGVDELFV